jgi:hypothetical protein
LVEFRKSHRFGGGSFVMILYAKSSATAGLFVSSRGGSICKELSRPIYFLPFL